MLRNITQNKVIAKDYIVCKFPWSQARGLMFSKKKNLIFVFRNVRKISLHMLFVFFPIDVLFLDENKIVVEIKKNLKPFTFYNSDEKAKYVIELTTPSSVSVGDELSFLVG